MTVLLIDNYDSFVYNLARYINELGATTLVMRNDAISLEQIREQVKPNKIIISPGPCDPDSAGISLSVIKTFGETVPILGVCLGHQAIGQAFGAKVIRSNYPVHGKSSLITHNQLDVFKGLPNPLSVGRYHSLIVSHENLPNELLITAKSDTGEIMGLRHQTYPIFGVQFHPESIITEFGYALLTNFLNM